LTSTKTPERKPIKQLNETKTKPDKTTQARQTLTETAAPPTSNHQLATGQQSTKIGE